MDAASEVAQLLEGLSDLLAGVAHQLRCARLPLLGALLGHPQGERQRYEALLGPVVEVALEAAALGVGGGDHAGLGAAQLRHLGGQLRVLVRAEQLQGEPAVQAAERAERGDSGEEQKGAERHERQRLRHGVDAQPETRPVVDRSGQQRGASPEHDHRQRERHDPGRQLQHQEHQVLPGGRVGEAPAQQSPARGSRRRAPVGVRDLDAHQRSDQAPLALRHPAPDEQHQQQHGQADERDRAAEPERQARHQDRELRDPERQRQQQVGDARVGLPRA